MRAKLSVLWQTLLSSYWFVPTIMAIAAVIAAFATLQLDEVVGSERANRVSWLYTGGADGARQVLATIAGSTITVAGTTFSITIAVLTLASAQFGPRLLRNFMRDTGNQLVLGTFTATFLYCLLVLRRVQGLSEFQFVPHIAVTVGILLALASIGVLIYFIHHVTASIQIANVVAATRRDLDQATERLFPNSLGAVPPASPVPDRSSVLPPGFATDAAQILATGSGYLRSIDGDALTNLTRVHDLVLHLQYAPGDFVVEARPIALVWPSDRADAMVASELNALMFLANERSPVQDVEFPVNQIVEIAVRALSPGINDPFTAMTCLDHLGAALSKLAGREMPSPYRDVEGVLRVITPSLTFADIVDAAFDQIRRNSRSSVAVTIHLLGTLRVVAAACSTEERRAVVRRHAGLVHRGAQMTEIDPTDRASIDDHYRAVIATLAHATETSASY